MPEEAPDQDLVQEELAEKEERKLNTVLRAGAIAQIIVGATVILAICYMAKLVLITLLVSVLLAFMLDPLVSLLETSPHTPGSRGIFSGAGTAGCDLWRQLLPVCPRGQLCSRTAQVFRENPRHIRARPPADQ